MRLIRQHWPTLHCIAHCQQTPPTALDKHNCQNKLPIGVRLLQQVVNKGVELKSCCVPTEVVLSIVQLRVNFTTIHWQWCIMSASNGQARVLADGERRGGQGEQEEEEERPMGNPVPAIVSPHPIRLLMTPPSSSSLSFSTHPTPKQHLSQKLPSIPIAKYFAPN